MIQIQMINGYRSGAIVAFSNVCVEIFSMTSRSLPSNGQIDLYS